MTIPSDMKAHNRKVIEEFRAAGGRAHGRPMMLLTTTGARTGRPHTAPMMYIPHGDDILVVASNAGAPKDPDWYRNLVAHPEVVVEAEGETYDATAVVPRGDERDRIFAGVVERYPFFADHQAKAGRSIPVVVLRRR
ncbi:nitroreductase family deazaflavin-dependent oxidoreductase [Phytohabitans kaempferiae]|uniref:Nitroreductase family deazaflavin-dependent oxidoreductase n=1 Tax=Phytohabitans kaempferiae TaxID=1620943 RepID=A0ABV6MB54_9ACTN